HQHRPALSVRGPEVIDLPVPQMLAGEAGTLQAFGDQRLAAGVIRRDRRTGDELAGEVKDLGHGMQFIRNDSTPYRRAEPAPLVRLPRRAELAPLVRLPRRAELRWYVSPRSRAELAPLVRGRRSQEQPSKLGSTAWRKPGVAEA